MEKIQEMFIKDLEELARASQVVLVIKNLPAHAADTRDWGLDSLGQEDPGEDLPGLGRSSGRRSSAERILATHTSTLVWKNPMDREAWWAMVHRVA